MNPIVFLNGRMVPESEAQVRVDDGGWLHGAGLFETIRAENGTPFCLELHIARLRRSAESILRPIDRSDLPGEDDVRELLQANGLAAARLRLTVSAGSMRVGANDQPPLNVCMTAASLSGYPARMYTGGAGIVVSNYRQSPFDPVGGHKTTSYLPRLIAMREAQQAGRLEAIWFTTQNYLAEGCVSNVFLVKDGGLRTPPLDTPILPGITRALVMVLAKEENMEAEQTQLTINDVLDADEILLTNAIMQVMPVVRVEGHEIGKGVVGPTARFLLEKYRDKVKMECGAI